MTAATIPGLLTSGDPAAPALGDVEDRAWSYVELRGAVDRLAGQLRSAGVKREDVVGLVLPNGPAAAIGFLAAATAGIAAPLNPTYREGEFRFYLEDLAARVVVTAPGASPLPVPRGARQLELSLEGEPCLTAGDGTALTSGPIAPPAPGDVALILHTSGTTARPKMVPLTHANLAASAGNVQQSLDLEPGDCCLNVMPLFRIHGLVASLLASLTAGARVVCTPGFDAFRFFDWLDTVRPTWYTAVPTMHRLIAQRGASRADVVARHRLRLVRSSSAALPPVVMEQIEGLFGVPLVEAYGMTEAAHEMASNPLPPAPRKPGSVGLGMGVEIAILAEGGLSKTPQRAGEVVVRGPNLMAGYRGDAEASASAFVEGWVRTGDQGHLDEDGYLWLTGRLKEMINRGGEKVAPGEVEEVLLRHGAVSEAVVFALPHPSLGEAVGAAVVLAPGQEADERALRMHVLAELADFKVPASIVFLDEIPKGPTGKVQRIGLAARLGLSQP